MKKQRGFTAIELIATIWVCVCFFGVGFAAYIAWHFIAKFW